MVVGRDRLPTYADRPHLPYVNALISEVHRWHTVTPTGEQETSLWCSGILGVTRAEQLILRQPFHTVFDKTTSMKDISSRRARL